MIKKILFFILIVLIFSHCNSSKEMINSTTVKELDLKRYLGKWYEIARLPNSFEKGLTGITANYSLREDGKIKVINQGYKKSLEGKLNVAVGKAKLPDPNEPGKLKVSFFWIFYADYNILELDSLNYQWALIGGSSAKYLWILSRTPKMDEATYSMIVEKARERGYQVEKLIKVLQ